jgi:hypothetical protein
VSPLVVVVRVSAGKSTVHPGPFRARRANGIKEISNRRLTRRRPGRTTPTCNSTSPTRPTSARPARKPVPAGSSGPASNYPCRIPPGVFVPMWDVATMRHEDTGHETSTTVTVRRPTPARDIPVSTACGVEPLGLADDLALHLLLDQPASSIRTRSGTGQSHLNAFISGRSRREALENAQVTTLTEEWHLWVPKTHLRPLTWPFVSEPDRVARAV